MDELLRDLQALQRDRYAPFESLAAFSIWADEVLPRLSFSPTLTASFRHAVSHVDSQRALKLPTNDAMAKAVGIVNQAVVALKVEIANAKQKSSADSNDKITIQWLKNHVSVKWWWTIGAGVLAGAGLMMTAGYKLAHLEASLNSTNKPIATQEGTMQTRTNIPTK